jgi:hypothetical protein
LAHGALEALRDQIRILEAKNDAQMRILEAKNDALKVQVGVLVVELAGQKHPRSPGETSQCLRIKRPRIGGKPKAAALDKSTEIDMDESTESDMDEPDTPKNPKKMKKEKREKKKENREKKGKKMKKKKLEQEKKLMDKPECSKKRCRRHVDQKGDGKWKRQCASCIGHA